MSSCLCLCAQMFGRLNVFLALSVTISLVCMVFSSGLRRMKTCNASRQRDAFFCEFIAIYVDSINESPEQLAPGFNEKNNRKLNACRNWIQLVHSLDPPRILLIQLGFTDSMVSPSRQSIHKAQSSRQRSQKTLNNLKSSRRIENKSN